jgi:hypothetical protein
MLNNWINNWHNNWLNQQQKGYPNGALGTKIE